MAENFYLALAKRQFEMLVTPSAVYKPRGFPARLQVIRGNGRRDDYDVIHSTNRRQQLLGDGGAQQRGIYRVKKYIRTNEVTEGCSATDRMRSAQIQATYCSNSNSFAKKNTAF